MPTLPDAMTCLLQWFNAASEADTRVRAAMAPLSFETIHPFEDGTGRLGGVPVERPSPDAVVAFS